MIDITLLCIAATVYDGEDEPLTEHTEAMRLLLLLIADTSGDAEVVAYKRAIAFYAENIDRIWPGDDDSD